MAIFAIFVISFFVFLALVILGGRHRFSPVRVWMAMWSVAWLMNWLFGQVFYFSSDVVLVIFAGVLLYVIGAMAMWAGVRTTDQMHAEQARNLEGELKNAKWLNALLLGLLLAAVLLMELGLRKISGNSLIGFLTSGRSGIFEIMRANQAALYHNDGADFPAEFKLVTLILTLTSIFICYRMSFSARIRSNTISLLILTFVSILFSGVTGVRSLLLVPLIVGFFSFYTGCVLNNRTRILTNWRTVTAAMVLVTGFIVWVILVQSARLGDLNFSRTSATLEHMRPWIAGYVSALSVWFEGQYNASDLGFGRVLFRAVLGPLGLVSGEGFDERIDAMVIGNWQTSNAMTLFRVLIQDFGSVGAVIVCAVLGFLGEFTYLKALRRGGIWIVLLIVVYCSVFFSINFWFFFYGARVFGVIGAIVLMAYVSARVRRQVMANRSTRSVPPHSAAPVGAGEPS